MIRELRERRSKVGLSPGSHLYTGDRTDDPVTIQLIEYDPDGDIDEQVVDDVGALARAMEPGRVSWINVSGLHEIAVVAQIGELFNIHPLLLEDILHTNQRPKFDEIGDTLYVIVRMLTWNEEEHGVDNEQVTVVVGDHYVISFQEREQDVFDPLRRRLREGKGRLRGLGSDYLAYAIIDAVVDHYFVLLEQIGDHVEELEEALLSRPTPEALHQIQRVKRSLLFTRKSIWPLREVVGALQRGDSPHFREETLPYLRDVYDHTIQAVDTVETFRDLVSSMLDIYLSSVSNRLNEVMRVLTVISTIFIPLTFITGVYGMNFEFMPELGWRPGYPVILAIMGVIGGSLALYFHRRGWI